MQFSLRGKPIKVPSEKEPFKYGPVYTNTRDKGVADQSSLKNELEQFLLKSAFKAVDAYFGTRNSTQKMIKYVHEEKPWNTVDKDMVAGQRKTWPEIKGPKDRENIKFAERLKKRYQQLVKDYVESKEFRAKPLYAAIVSQLLTTTDLEFNLKGVDSDRQGQILVLYKEIDPVSMVLKNVNNNNALFLLSKIYIHMQQGQPRLKKLTYHATSTIKPGKLKEMLLTLEENGVQIEPPLEKKEDESLPQKRKAKTDIKEKRGKAKVDQEADEL
jgi:hypothetical protein